MKTFKTPKGTELPLMDIRGKDYLQVAHRLVWFREEHGDWGIETDVIPQQDSAIAKATIRDTSGRVIATATKFEDRKGFPDFIEKAETGAVGRALALCGYGTQFAEELDEGERLADSPVQKKSPPLKKQPETSSLPPAITPKKYIPSTTESMASSGVHSSRKPHCLTCGEPLSLSPFGYYCKTGKVDKKRQHTMNLKEEELDSFFFNNDPANVDVP